MKRFLFALALGAFSAPLFAQDYPAPCEAVAPIEAAAEPCLPVCEYAPTLAFEAVAEPQPVFILERRFVVRRADDAACFAAVRRFGDCARRAASFPRSIVRAFAVPRNARTATERGAGCDGACPCHR